MTLEIDLERVVAVTDRLRRHQTAMGDVVDHLRGVGRRTQLVAEASPAAIAAEGVAQRIGLAADFLARRADAASRADTTPVEPTSFAGGTALCSAIQLVSPIPAPPSTSGVTGVIDMSGLAHDAVSAADTAASGAATVAGRGVPFAAFPAAALDLAMCRLRVGSGAAISTRKIVDEDGNEIYEGSRSPHKHRTSTGETLHPDLTIRDRQMWRVEHSNENGFLMEPYPGYPAYEVNAPRH